MHRRIRTLLLALAVSGLATPVLAAPLAHEHYSGTDSFTVDDLCGTDWSVEVTFSGNFMLKAGRHGDATPYYFDNYSYVEVWTDVTDPTQSSGSFASAGEGRRRKASSSAPPR